MEEKLNLEVVEKNTGNRASYPNYSARENQTCAIL